MLPASPSVLSPRLRAAAAALVLCLVGAVTAPSPALGAPHQRADAGRQEADTFGIATFNILGSQHTRGHSRFKPGTVRARVTASMIKKRGLDLVGMQEVQADQLHVLKQRLPDYRIWPADSWGPQGIRLQVAFDTTKFAFVRGGYRNAPFSHQTVPIPWVELRDLATGRLFYTVVFHNTSGHDARAEHERFHATGVEIALVNKLRRTGKAVFLMGDANDKEHYYCQVAGSAHLTAANGGHASSPSHCRPPEGYLPIDWIFGKGHLSFSDYSIDEDAQVRRASDHHLVHAVVTM